MPNKILKTSKIYNIDAFYHVKKIPMLFFIPTTKLGVRLNAHYFKEFSY